MHLQTILLIMAGLIQMIPLTCQAAANSIGMEFVYIPPGIFMMGSPASEPIHQEDETQHQVTLTQGFYLQTTEVTQGQWKAVMGNNPSFFKNCGDNCPVEQVSWEDVQKFIRKLNQMEDTDKYRLPTEAEWEYACRAGSTGRYYYGDDKSQIGKYAWHLGNSMIGPRPVAQKKPNAWGLYDMLGNVQEWCQDWYGKYPANPVTDPTGPSGGHLRVLRGGAHNTVADFFSCFDRSWNIPDKGFFQEGFRCAKSK